MDKLDYLVNYLLNERDEDIVIPNNIDDKKKLYKALCNIREPRPISDEYIKVENEYLQEENIKRGIINIKDISLTNNNNIKNKDIISIWQGDITRLRVDAIVNPANSQGLGCFNPNHKCLDNIIGVSSGVCLRLECNEIMKDKNYNLETSDVIITKGYNLASNYIIHTVGPIIDYDVTDKDKYMLKNCYINCLELAKKNNIRTVAFPCISTGLFRFPKDIASKIAINAVDVFLDLNRDYFDRIIFCVFSDDDYNYYINY